MQLGQDDNCFVYIYVEIHINICKCTCMYTDVIALFWGGFMTNACLNSIMHQDFLSCNSLGLLQTNLPAVLTASLCQMAADQFIQG